MTTEGALAAVESLAREAGDALLVGVGSVLDADGARRAVEAGARFVVSPVLAPDVVRETLRQGAAAVCGAFTPTEAHAAHAAGAELVKLFPADALGPAFLRGVLAPMPFLRVMPTGGVTVQSLGGWLRAGAVAVGLGSALVDPRLVEDRAFAALTERARLVAAAVAGARGGGA
jgi:2-dehydro-3-deoxyphosphogluconate aldolase/(4S)-4-hydroxy-2-oxoglutarate aldolase